MFDSSECWCLMMNVTNIDIVVIVQVFKRLKRRNTTEVELN